MTRIVIACDKFKGSATASDISGALSRGIVGDLGPGVNIVPVPVADGGDGTIDAALSISYKKHICCVSGPYGVPTEAAYAFDPVSRTAVLEVAEACGLRLVDAHGVDSGAIDGTTARTDGVGQLISAALDQGARKIILGLGGSATSDGGAGMLAALGARLLTREGAPVDPSGAGLAEIASVTLEGLDDRIAETEFIIASDVTNPLCGAEGAAAVYGPQKGVGEDQVPALDAALGRYAELIEEAMGAQPGAFSSISGAGAAGGLGFASTAVLGGAMQSGADLVLDLVGFDDALKGADLVITGEGRFDSQTLQGKAPARVSERAREAGVRTVAVCGTSDLSDQQVRSVGIEELFALTDVDPDVRRCIADPLPLMEDLGRKIATRL
ncbi:glycerate kinase [Kocuria sp. TGY1127_2]|uniref:glycerate kinase n=1 Tax=Kocuria sp. TGY1127_2 TaxID=2711328 RepID=UPI001FAC0F77|nr:glycerate kinase [Kocuria sp. TGY1127_2]